MILNINKILLIIGFVIIGVSNSNCQIRVQTDTVKVYPIESKNITLLNRDSINDSVLLLLNQLQGCLCDPDFRKTLGISIIGSLKSPNLGLDLDFTPFYLNIPDADLLLRSDFHKNYIFRVGGETKEIFKKLPIGFKVEYNGYNLLKTSLNDYCQYTIGMVYRVPWFSVGLLVGKDNYSTGNVGCELYSKYRVHMRINRCCEPYKSIANIYTRISYWRGEINYDLQLNYLLDYTKSIGIGYRKLFDVKELFFTYQFVIRY